MLFEPFSSRSLRIANRIVMAPMTRCRAVDANTPNALMAEYYAQRATAGLIITEGTSPSPNGLGYARIPGLFNAAQVRGWKLATDAVHARGGKIFVQIMHTGRVGHVDNLPAGAEMLGPMAESCPGEIFTDLRGMQAHSPARAMDERDIAQAVGDYARTAERAMEAGFDGVELHAANGYLLEQFLNVNVNRRTDGYGGSIVNRNRLVVEVVQAAVAAIGADRVGIRLSPYGAANATGAFPEVEVQFLSLARELSRIGVLYLHLVDHSAMGAPPVPVEFKKRLRSAFDEWFIASGGFDRESAEQALTEKRADWIAFGRPFLANPDLVERMRVGAPIQEADTKTFYTPGPEGYTDYATAG